MNKDFEPLSVSTNDYGVCSGQNSSVEYLDEAEIFDAYSRTVVDVCETISP